MRKRILLDIDGVVADLVGKLCRELTAAGYPRFPRDIVTYQFEGCLEPAENAIVQAAMARPGFCTTIGAYPGADAFVDGLKKRGDVVAVTKAFPKGPTWAHEREHWLAPWRLPVISTGAKGYVAGDYLIEDSTANATTWAEAQTGHVILIDRPWNRDVVNSSRLTRVESFAEALRVIDTHGGKL